jgi:hypothetical protein
MKDRATTALPKPATTGTTKFKDALNPISANADLKLVGIGVIDFTRDPNNPDVWLHNPKPATPNADRPYRIGSASKIAMMLAAVQLRLDVQRIRKLNIITTGPEFDELFRNPKLWKKAKPPQTEMQQIADPRKPGAPLISKIFDFNKNPIDFLGLDPNGRKDADDHPVAAVQKVIVDKLTVDPKDATHVYVPWEKWSTFTFSDRLWLAGSMSDNVAATACVSQIGVPYIKAVQRSYGLFDPAHGMHLFASYGYDEIPSSLKSPAPAPPRQLTYREPIDVEDYWWNPGTGKFSNKPRSWVPGSASALTAYMIALMTDVFAVDPAKGTGADGCTTIKKNLGDGGPNSVETFLVTEGVKSVPHTKVTKQIDKVGILQKSKKGAQAYLRCDFVYLETKQDPAPAHGRNAMKYAVVCVGVISEADSGGHSARVKTRELGAAVHKALLTL